MSHSGNPLAVIYIACKIQEIIPEYVTQCLQIKSFQQDSLSPVFSCDPDHRARLTVDPDLMLLDPDLTLLGTRKKPCCESSESDLQPGGNTAICLIVLQLHRMLQNHCSGVERR